MQFFSVTQVESLNWANLNASSPWDTLTIASSVRGRRNGDGTAPGTTMDARQLSSPPWTWSSLTAWVNMTMSLRNYFVRSVAFTLLLIRVFARVFFNLFSIFALKSQKCYVALRCLVTVIFLKNELTKSQSLLSTISSHVLIRVSLTVHFTGKQTRQTYYNDNYYLYFV